jgi:hypothetical protein
MLLLIMLGCCTAVTAWHRSNRPVDVSLDAIDEGSKRVCPSLGAVDPNEMQSLVGNLKRRMPNPHRAT